MKKITYSLITVSIVFYIISLLTFKLDVNFTHRWSVLYLSLFPLLLVFILYTLSAVSHKTVWRSVSIYGFLIILLFAIITRFLFLTDYPFVSVGDELRDGGLDAQAIATAQTKNIFGYGRYNSHGLIIPTITSIFYKIFGSSVLVYRLPAAIVSILDIVLFYFLLSFLTKNKIASFLGTTVLISLPLHIFYSRTEIVVILSSLFSTIVLLGLFVFFRRKMTNIIDYIFLGTLIGFIFNLHASIKAMGIIVLIVTILIGFYQWFWGKLKVSQFSIRLLLLIIFVFVGFGPRLFNTSLSIFLHTSRLPIVTEKQLNVNSGEIKNFVESYIKSLLVWITEPTNAWYPDHKPIFSPLLFFLMILGIITSLVKKNFYLVTVMFIALFLHLSNSALTDILNGDHRLAPLYPIGVLFVGVGIAFLLEKIKSRLIKYTFTFTLLVFLSYQIILFFINQPVNKNKDVGDYLSMHTVYFLKKNNSFNKLSNLTFLVSPGNYQKFNYLHYKEKYNFFFPKMNIFIEKADTIGDNVIYIKNNNYNYFGKNIIVKCSGKEYYCPVDYKKNIVIHY